MSLNEEVFNNICDRLPDLTQEDIDKAKAWGNAVLKCYTYSADGQPGYIQMGQCLTKKQMERYFWAIEQCTCCGRHANARPVWVDCDLLSPNLPCDETNCECLCRHNLRWLHRAYKLAKE